MKFAECIAGEQVEANKTAKDNKKMRGVEFRFKGNLFF